jgi:uncharacterized repeat protein (TIGR04076 family)
MRKNRDMDVPVKITVLRRLLNKDLVSLYGESEWTYCERFREGEEFVARGVNMPEGFCSWAWVDIQKYVMTLSRGGNLLGFKPGTCITCCTDGLRPVIFKLEVCHQG